MAGRRSELRSTIYTTPVAVYRTVSTDDSGVSGVEQVIDLSNSALALNTLLLYVDGNVGVTVDLYVQKEDLWFWFNTATSTHSREGFNFIDVPAAEVKVVITNTSGTVTVYEEHTK